MNEQQKILMFKIGALLNDFNALTDYQGDRMVVALREEIEALAEMSYNEGWEMCACENGVETASN